VQRLLAAGSPAEGLASVAELAADLAAGVRAPAVPTERDEAPAQHA
jgi:hypothetical protein